jgi:hypothetical protein
VGVTAKQWTEWAPRCLVSRRTLRHRLQAGWPLETALTTPVKSDAGETQEHVCAILRVTPHRTTRELMAATGRTEAAIEHTLKRGIMGGTLVKHRNGQRVDYTLAADADAGFATRPWIHPIRARALGLPVATRPAGRHEAPTFSNPHRDAS